MRFLMPFTSVILIDLEPQNRRVLMNFCNFGLHHSELKQNGWIYQVDQTYLRTGAVVGYRASHEH